MAESAGMQRNKSIKLADIKGLDERKAARQQLRRSTNLIGLPEAVLDEDLDRIEDYNIKLNTPFVSHFKANEMRQLALVAHNHMKPAMRRFVESHSEILKKFRITGTNTTMKLCKELFAGDPDVKYGNTFTSGPLGGDAQLAALMVMEDVGGVIFFVDPLTAHPHQADIDSLIRLTNVNNIMLVTNPATGTSMMYLLKCALENKRKEMMPSFFYTLESPAVEDYKKQQKAALQAVVQGQPVRASLPPVDRISLREQMDQSDDDEEIPSQLSQHSSNRSLK